MIKEKAPKTWLFVLLCIFVFLISIVGSIIFKLTYTPRSLRSYSVKWDDNIGTIKKDLPYGDKPANKFDLYLPADTSKENYRLVVYLHAGGFTSGDKSDDAAMLEWLCSKGYVACGINYTLFSEDNPDANVYTQSIEIKESVPYVINAAKKFGYNIDSMAISGGSAGGCLSLLYAYRDADEAPVPVKMVFEAVGPSSFYPEDWKNYGGEENAEAVVALFSIMAGKELPADKLGTEEYDEAIKDISALLWVDDDTVPTVMAYGVYDTMQSYEASIKLDSALTEHNIQHEYIVCEHSGHGLQNDTKQYIKYMQKIEKYLATYLPVE